MAAYSVSNIVGYAAHLPTKVVRLPLKYSPPTRPDDVSEKFRNGCLGSSEIVDLSLQRGTFFPAAQVGVTNDMRVLRLLPLLVDETTLLGLQFQNLNIELPHPVVSNRTVACQFVADNGNGEPFLLLDIIDQSFLFLTLRIELSDFIVGNTNRLSVDNFSEWVNISVPYSFELRSLPFCMRALDPANLVVSMRDGGLLHFCRDEPLGAFNIYDFSENAPLMSLNIVNYLFRSSEPADSSLNGVLSNAAVDIVALSSDEFVTLSATKTLSFWSLSSHQQSRPKIQAAPSKDSVSWLSTVPNRFLVVTSTGSESHVTRLSVCLPSGTALANTAGSKFEISSWAVSESALEKDWSFAIQETADSLLERGLDSNVMTVQDFYVQSAPETLKYHILWKCNTYSSVVSYVVSPESGSVENTTHSHILNISPIEELMSMRGDGEIMDAIFNSGNYDEDIVTTALEVFEQNLGIATPMFTDGYLRKHVTNVINSVSESHGVNPNSLWYKFALICDEFKKTSQESLALLSTTDYLITSQVNGVGVFRLAHYYEEQNWNLKSSALAALLNSVASRFSLKVFKQVLGEIKKGKPINASDATNYATDFLSSRISDEETEDLMNSLASIPDVLEEIQSLVTDPHAKDILVPGVSAPFTGEGCGLLSKIVAIDTFKNIKKNHEQILLNLFVLLLLSEVNDTILEIFNAIIQKFNNYALMTQVFELSFKDSRSKSPIETHSISKSENSLFWKCAVARNDSLLQLILRKEYNLAFDYYCDVILSQNHESFLLDIFLELLNRNEVKIILEDLVKKIDTSLAIIKFLLGLVYLFNNQFEEFYTTFIDYLVYSMVKDQTTKEKLVERLNSQKIIKLFLSSVFTAHSLDFATKANYYHSLGNLCVAYAGNLKTRAEFGGIDLKLELLQKSVLFEKKAIEALESGSNQSSHDPLKMTYLRNLYSNAVEIKNYDDAVSALNDINGHVSPSEMKTLLSKLIRALLVNNKLELLFKKNSSDLFKQNYLQVDSIILEIANEDLILSNALRCYEYLYSWRLLGCVNTAASGKFGDVRGAAEALYIFITRFNLEKDILVSESTEFEDYKQFKLRILELYKIIINCLKTFKEVDDRWIIKRDTSNRLVIATVDELTLEYYKWLQELEKELS